MAQIFVLTKLREVFSQPGPLVRGLYPTAEAAMLAHNRFYFGEDLGVKFEMLEGWQTAEEYNADDNCPPLNMVEPTADVWVFNDEGDLVFVQAMEVTA